MLIKPTFISYSRRNTRTGTYYETDVNELASLNFDVNDWYCYPAHVGASLAYVYFHRDYMSHGIALSNLFEFVHMDEISGKKPDLIYILVHLLKVNLVIIMIRRMIFILVLHHMGKK